MASAESFGDLGYSDEIAIASSTEPFFELRLPDRRSGAYFVADFDQADTA
jgi:hypothetical protein